MMLANLVLKRQPAASCLRAASTAAAHGSNIIGGSLSKEGSTTFPSFEPKGGSSEGSFHEATASEVDRAATLAAAAYEDFRDCDAETVAALLDRVADGIEEAGSLVCEVAMRETGLPEPRINGERDRTCGQLRQFARLVEEGSWVEARVNMGHGKPDLRRMLAPLGPVAVFGASNFPLAFSVAGGDTASALAARNPVVVKAHPAHPETSEVVAGVVSEAVAACGLPAGTFSMVHGQSPDVGLGLVTHPAIQAVGFTGSLGGGRALFDAAAARPQPIPVYAEMGSVNPVFVLPEALQTRMPAITGGLAGSVTLGVGQFCTSPGIVVAVDPAPDTPEWQGLPPQHRGQFKRFGDDLSRAIEKVAPGTMLTAGIKQAFEAGRDRVAATAGVEEVTAERHATEGWTEAGGVVFRCSAETFLSGGDRAHLHHEVFGPLVLLVSCGSHDEMLRVAKALEGQLTATVWGTDEEFAEYRGVVRTLQECSGRLICNGYPTGVEVCAAMNHGGPYPASSSVHSTSVGTEAIKRFARPVAFQDWPPASLPAELQDGNPRGILRLVNGDYTRDPVADDAYVRK